MAVTPQKQHDQKDDTLFDDDAELQRVLDQWQRALSEVPDGLDAEFADLEPAVVAAEEPEATAPEATVAEPWPPAEEPPGASWRRIAAAAAVAKAASKSAAEPATLPQRAEPEISATPTREERVKAELEKDEPAKAEPDKARPVTARAEKAVKQAPASPQTVTPSSPGAAAEQSLPPRSANRSARRPAAISGDKSPTHHHNPATPVTLPRARLEKTANRSAESEAANQNTPQAQPRETPPPSPSPSPPVESPPVESKPVEQKSVEDERIARASDIETAPPKHSVPIPANENNIAPTPQPPQAVEPAPQKTAKPAPGARIAPNRMAPASISTRRPERESRAASPDTAKKASKRSEKKEKPADKWRRRHPRAAQSGSPFENPLPPKPSGRRKPPIVSATAVKMYTDPDESAKKPPKPKARPKTRRENGPQKGPTMGSDRALGAKPEKLQPQSAARRTPNPRTPRTATDLSPGTMRMTAPADAQTKPKTAPKATKKTAKKATKSVAETPSGKGANDENFPVGSFLLPAKLRPHVAKYYAFARAVDDIADNPELTPEDKIARLDAFDAALNGKSGYGEDYAKAHALRDSLQQLDITTDHGSHLLIAFREDAVKTRYANWTELMHYCSNSANPVGRYLLDLHGEDKADYPYSDALCTVLQVLNHMQDCADDLANLDRCYIPQDWMAAEGTGTADLTKPELTPGMRAVFDRMLDELDDMMRTARVLPVVMKNRHLAMESATIVNLADRLAAKLRKRDPLAARVSLSKADFVFSGLAGILKGLFKK